MHGAYNVRFIKTSAKHSIQTHQPFCLPSHDILFIKLKSLKENKVSRFSNIK